MPKKRHPASKCSEIEDFWHVRNVPFQTDAGFRFFVHKKISNETMTFSIEGEDKLGWLEESAEKRGIVYLTSSLYIS